MILNFEAEAKTYKVKVKNHEAEAETEANIPVKSWPKFGSRSNVI